MKKFIVSLFLSLMIILTLVGCSGEYKYAKIKIDDNWQIVEITNYCFYTTTMTSITLKDGTKMIINNESIVLMNKSYEI